MQARFAFAAVLLGALGCGSSSSSPVTAPSTFDGAASNDEAGTPGGPDDGGNTVGLDAMPTGALDSSSPAGLPTTFAKYGTVGAQWIHDVMAGKDTTLTATVFVDYGSLGGTCTRVTVDSCVHVSCSSPDGGSLPPLIDPGPVQIGAAPAPFNLTFQGASTPVSGSMPLALWPPGTTIPMTSQGSTSVPAWSTSVTMPPLATVTSPMITGDAMNFTRQSDLSLTWTGTPEIVVSLSSNVLNSEQLYCTFSGGQGVLPGANLSLVPAGRYDLQIFTANRQYFLAGDWSIRATADTLATCANGARCDVPSFTLD